MKSELKYNSVPHDKSPKTSAGQRKRTSGNGADSSVQNDESDADLPNILRLFKQQLHIFIEEQNEVTLKRGDFERIGKLADPSKPFGDADNNEEDEDQMQSEGRKSYMKIKTRKNWPPTMEDLLEYITIYSQMNNIKFTSLNYDEFHEKKNNKTKHRKANSTFNKKWMASQKSIARPEKDTNTFRKESSRDTRQLSRSKNITMKTQESVPENQDVRLLQNLIDSVSIIEVTESGDRKSSTTRESAYKFRFNYSELYQVLFGSSCCDHEGIKFLDSDNYKQNEMLRAIIVSMNQKITSRSEDVISTIDVLEYFVKILTEIPNKNL